MFGQVEIEILRTLESWRTPFLSKLAEIITMLGEETVFILLAAVLYFIIDKKYAQKLIFIMCCGTGLNGIVKNFARIPRPFVVDPTLKSVRVETATGYSFPSGHTQTASGWMTVLAQKLKKTWAWVVAVVLFLLVGFSRMFLGVHYPSDVAVGLILGVGGALLFGWLYDRKENKLPVLAAALCVQLVFAVVFLFMNTDEQFADYYKMFGFTAGYVMAYLFEDKYVRLSNDIPLWKRIIRCVVGVALALGLKEGFKILFGLIPVGLVGGLILQMVRYMVLAFFILGLYPWLCKKVKF